MPRRRRPEKLSKSDFAPLSTCFSTKSPKSRIFLTVFASFCTGFLQKHGNLHICRHEAVPKHHVLQCFQCPYFPKLWKISLFTVFLQFFSVRMLLANSNIYTRNPSKTLFFTMFFTMFPSKNTIIYMFLAIKSFQNTSFCSAVNALASKNLSEHRYLHNFTQFFSLFAGFSIAGSLPKFHVNTLLSSDTQKASKNHENTN